MDGAINHVFQKSDLCGADQCRSHTTGHMQQSLAWCSSPDHMLVAKNVHLVSCHSWWRKLQGLESSSFSLLDSTGENKICFSSLSWSLMKKIEDYTFSQVLFLFFTRAPFPRSPIHNSRTSCRMMDKHVVCRLSRLQIIKLFHRLRALWILLNSTIMWAWYVVAVHCCLYF